MAYTLVGNIKGDTGPQGQQGPTGPTGPQGPKGDPPSSTEVQTAIKTLLTTLKWGEMS